MVRQTTAEAAVRVRDNQRRSRARRTERFQQLEERVRVSESGRDEADRQLQQAEGRLAQENSVLRSLLLQIGFTIPDINDHLQIIHGICGGSRSVLADNAVLPTVDRSNEIFPQMPSTPPNMLSQQTPLTSSSRNFPSTPLTPPASSLASPCRSSVEAVASTETKSVAHDSRSLASVYNLQDAQSHQTVISPVEPLSRPCPASDPYDLDVQPLQLHRRLSTICIIPLDDDKRQAEEIPEDTTSCLEAAIIVANMRGEDVGQVCAELECCSPPAQCRIPNSRLFDILDV